MSREGIGEIVTLADNLKRIAEIIENVDRRCMVADGPVTNTREEMTDDEMEEIYKLASGSAEVVDTATLTPRHVIIFKRDKRIPGTGLSKIVRYLKDLFHPAKALIVTGESEIRIDYMDNLDAVVQLYEAGIIALGACDILKTHGIDKHLPGYQRSRQAIEKALKNAQSAGIGFSRAIRENPLTKQAQSIAPE